VAAHWAFYRPVHWVVRWEALVAHPAAPWAAHSAAHLAHSVLLQAAWKVEDRRAQRGDPLVSHSVGH